MSITSLGIGGYPFRAYVFSTSYSITIGIAYDTVQPTHSSLSIPINVGYGISTQEGVVLSYLGSHSLQYNLPVNHLQGENQNFSVPLQNLVKISQVCVSPIWYDGRAGGITNVHCSWILPLKNRNWELPCITTQIVSCERNTEYSLIERNLVWTLKERNREWSL